MHGLVLGSTSAYRKSLLERLRLPFEQAEHGIDESVVKRSGGEPAAIVQRLAQLKAHAVLQRHPDAVVIGSDQAVTIDGGLLDKPGTPANAGAQLRKLRGREHQLLTAVAIAHTGGMVEWLDVTRLVMRELSDEEIDRYVQADNPIDCAGSYKLESLGIALFERIDGHDHTAVTGLPLLRLSMELRALGCQLP